MPDMNAKSTVLMIIAPERFRDEELFETQAELQNAGYETVIASTHRGNCPGSRGGQATAKLTLDEVRTADYEATVYVGGGGAKLLFNDERAWQIARETVQNGKVLGRSAWHP